MPGIPGVPLIPGRPVRPRGPVKPRISREFVGFLFAVETND